MYTNPIILPNSQKPFRFSVGDVEPRLPESALFDKVINVAIHRRNKSDIVIRSDYDLIIRGQGGRSTIVTPDDLEKNKKTGYNGMTWSIIRSCYKPSIQVKYTAISAGMIDTFDLMITNLFVFTGEGSMSLNDFMAEDIEQSNGVDKTSYPITGVDVLIGYASQFPKPNGPEDYFNVSVENAPIGVSAIRINGVNYCSYDKAPPNSIFRIHGYVGSAQRVKNDTTQYTGKTTLLQPTKELKAIEIPSASSLFYKLVQRRFIRDYHAWTRDFYSFKDAAVKAGVKEVKSAYIDKSDGYLNKAGAERYGCQVIIPSASTLNRFRFNQTEVMDENGNPVKVPINDIISQADTVAATLEALNNRFFNNELKYVQLLNGNYIVWSTNDTLTKNAKGKDIDPRFASPDKIELLNSLNEAVYSQMPSTDGKKIGAENKIIIPAVYNISVSAGKSIIKCPFFNLFNPFTIVQFNARYNLSDFARYYQRKGRNQVLFTVVNYTVDFSTTGKENMMTLLVTNQLPPARNSLVAGGDEIGGVDFGLA